MGYFAPQKNLKKIRSHFNTIEFVHSQIDGLAIWEGHIAAPVGRRATGATAPLPRGFGATGIGLLRAHSKMKNNSRQMGTEEFLSQKWRQIVFFRR